MTDNPLMALIETRRAECALTYSQVARRGQLSKSTVHKVAKTRHWRAMPHTSTLAGLAVGLNLPVSALRQAAAEAVGLVPASRPPDGDSILIANLRALSARERRMVAALVTEMVAQRHDTAGHDEQGGVSR